MVYSSVGAQGLELEPFVVFPTPGPARPGSGTSVKKHGVPVLSFEGGGPGGDPPGEGGGAPLRKGLPGL